MAANGWLWRQEGYKLEARVGYIASSRASWAIQGNLILKKTSIDCEENCGSPFQLLKCSALGCCIDGLCPVQTQLPQAFCPESLQESHRHAASQKGTKGLGRAIMNMAQVSS